MFLAKYSIDKTICSWDNSEGAGTQYRNIFSKFDTIECESVNDALQKICNIYGLSTNDFEAFNEEEEKNRYTAGIIENDEGNESQNGNWLADYNIYIDLYESQQDCEKLRIEMQGACKMLSYALDLMQHPEIAAISKYFCVHPFATIENIKKFLEIHNQPKSKEAP